MNPGGSGIVVTQAMSPPAGSPVAEKKLEREKGGKAGISVVFGKRLHVDRQPEGRQTGGQGQSQGEEPNHGDSGTTVAKGALVSSGLHSGGLVRGVGWGALIWLGCCLRSSQSRLGKVLL